MDVGLVYTLGVGGLKDSAVRVSAPGMSYDWIGLGDFNEWQVYPSVVIVNLVLSLTREEPL
jgi:hypothetical protein